MHELAPCPLPANWSHLTAEELGPVKIDCGRSSCDALSPLFIQIWLWVRRRRQQNSCSRKW